MKTGFLALAMFAAMSSLAADIKLIGADDENTKPFYSPSFSVKSGGCYRVTFAARHAPGAGGNCICAGLEGYNVDIKDVGEDWREHSFVMQIGDNHASSRARFSLWRAHGEFFVREGWKIEEVEPRYARCEAGELGNGESVFGNTYTFGSTWSDEGHTHSRTLKSFRRMSFNTDRIDFGGQGEMNWCFGLKGRKLQEGVLSFTRGYHNRGSLFFDASSDGVNWQRVLVLENASNMVSRVELPASLFPSENLHVRISADKGGIRLHGVSFRGRLDGEPLMVTGATHYARAGERMEEFTAEVPRYYAARTGALLPAAAPFLDLWSESSGSKVARERKLPTAQTDELAIATARNEAEAVQLVLTPRESLSEVSVALDGDLRQEDGKVLAAAIDILRVHYVEVLLPTKGSYPGFYPDALPPQTPNLTLQSRLNQPFWVRVKPAAAAAAGIYRGQLKVSGRRADKSSFALSVPFKVEVFDFDFPDEVTCRTAFGLYPQFIGQYHKVSNRRDLRRVYDLYLQAMADYHLSPYSPAMLSSWRVKWEGLAEAKKGDCSKLRPVFDFAAWDAEMERAFAKWHFNTFRVGSGLGLGGGDAAHRRKPELSGFEEGSPAYETMIRQLLGGFENHLREKRWRDLAIVYAFDEPSEKDDSFVMDGFAKLKKYAPGLQRFLTSPARSDLAGGPQIWCPIAPDLHAQMADACRHSGDTFWWYVCTCPKPPYPTLFIDRPGIDLRVWLWQAWAENVQGVLVWVVNLWNSTSKYPDKERPQNPYLDPMGWNPQAQPWGNGDGRFFYPPLAAADGRAKGPVFDNPVGSIRGEMLRDGIEDYEYFTILRRRLALVARELPAAKLAECEKLLKVPGDVYTTLTEYNFDPVAIEAHRRRLAHAIMDLGALMP